MGVYNLSEVAKFSTGKLNSNAANERGKYPFFTCAPSPLRINSYAFDKSAIILAGNNAEGNFHIQYFEGKFNAYQRTYVITSIDEDVVSTRYLYYALKNCLDIFKGLSQGSATKFLTAKILNSFRVDVPEKMIQDKIVGILDAIENKLVLNKKINKNLVA